MRRLAPFVSLALILAAAGCGAEDGDAPPPADNPDGANAPAPTALDAAQVAMEPEDSVIFRETMAWAAAEGVDTLALGDAIVALGRRFVGSPYVPGSLDPPGPERLVVNLRSFDCVTYVESMLAMARVLRSGEPTLDAFMRELGRLRYRTGVPVGYPSRLHYFSDWIATNEERGLVTDVTGELGGVEDDEPINFMTTHTDAYRQLADADALAEIRSAEERLSGRSRFVIPQGAIGEHVEGIRDGDVIAAASSIPGLDIAHTGLALWLDGRLHLMHAPLVGKSVEISTLPLAERILDIEGQDGILVARPL